MTLPGESVGAWRPGHPHSPGPSYAEMMAQAERQDGPWERVRRFYNVAARRGGRAIFTGLVEPITGRLTFCDGQYVWMRAEHDCQLGPAGTKIGPLHPTWELTYVA
jgi:hypothetical protein